MELEFYFDPLDQKFDKKYPKDSLGHSIIKNFENNFDIEGKNKIALFGIEEKNSSCEKPSDLIREQLYLLKNNFSLSVIDLGTLKLGKTQKDTEIAIRDIVSFFIEKGILIIILGEKQEYTYSAYLAYEKIKRSVSIVSINPEFNISTEKTENTGKNFIGKIILNKSNYLFNYCNLGFQTHYVTEKQRDLIKKMYFDAFRLGEIREDFYAIEPEIRDADLVSVSLNSVRHSDAPGTTGVFPNGFFGEEICQLVKYAGISDKTTCFGLFDLVPENDNNKQTSALSAQILYYFIEGVEQRKGDYPACSEKKYTAYHVSYDEGRNDLVFYNSPKSNRWWFEVKTKNRKILVSCSYNDYLGACENQLPDKYWKVCQKIM